MTVIHMETISPQFDWAMSFLAVVEAGGVTRAAERLGTSKAHVSKQLRRLEQALGAQLLYRTTRRISPTEAGQAYLGYCRQLRDTLDEAERAVSQLRQEVRGRVRLTVPTTFGVTYMAELVLAFRERYPEVEVDLDLSREQRDLIADGFDLAIRSTRTPDDRLVAKPLFVAQDWVVASPQALARFGRPETPQDLADKPCVVNTHFKDDDRWLFLHGDASEVVSVRHWLRVNDYTLSRRLALAGAGFVRLPRFAVEADVAAGLLVRVLTGFQQPHSPFYLIFPQRQPQPAKVRALIDFVETWFRTRPAESVLSG